MSNKVFTEAEALQIAAIDLTKINLLEVLSWLWEVAFEAGQVDVFTRGTMKVT